MDEKLRRPPSAVSFWILMLTVLAIIIAAFWYVIVGIAIPIIDAVRDAYF